MSRDSLRKLQTCFYVAILNGDLLSKNRHTSLNTGIGIKQYIKEHIL